MKKKQLIKEALIASILVIMIDFIISFFPSKQELVRPIKQGFNDFDIYDLRYSQNGEVVNKKDTNITILQIGDNRKQIAEEIKKVSSFRPKLIAIDAIFYDASNKEDDNLLIKSISTEKNLVVACEYQYNPVSKSDSIRNSFFADSIPDIKAGFFNFIEGAENIKRRFAPFLNINGVAYPSFTTQIAKQISQEAYQTLTARNNEIETINYSGNLEHYNSVSLDELFSPEKNITLNDYFKDKIVLIGFFRDKAPDVLEDFHFTPMNHKHSGKSFPDSYGIVVHANILEMLLNKNYINEMAEWLVYATAFLLTFALNIFYIRIVSKNHKHSHLKLFLFQMILALALIYIGLTIFSSLNYKIDLTPIIIAVILSFEVFWLYELLAIKLKKSLGYKTFVHD